MFLTRIVRAWPAGVVIALSLAPDARSQTKKAHDGPTFVFIVEARFPAWDRNHDGALSPAEVEALVVSPQVRGEEAAAVAAVHVYQRGHRTAGPLRKAQLLAHDTAPGGRRDVAQAAPHFLADYAGFCRHLRHAPRDMFAAAGAPNLNGFDAAL